MYGDHVGSLNVYTRTSIGGPLSLTWSQSYEKGDEWLRAIVALQVQQPFQVVIEGVRGIGYQGILFKNFFFLF
jgi:MAM domain, meprin/A5/mu